MTINGGATVRFENNQCSSSGGAIYFSACDLTFKDGSCVEFVNNSAVGGGAIYCPYSTSSSGTASAANLCFDIGSRVNFIENSASGGYGGAIDFQSRAGEVLINGKTNFISNKAGSEISYYNCLVNAIYAYSLTIGEYSEIELKNNYNSTYNLSEDSSAIQTEIFFMNYLYLNNDINVLTTNPNASTYVNTFWIQTQKYITVCADLQGVYSVYKYNVSLGDTSGPGLIFYSPDITLTYASELRPFYVSNSDISDGPAWVDYNSVCENYGVAVDTGEYRVDLITDTINMAPGETAYVTIVSDSGFDLASIPTGNIVSYLSSEQYFSAGITKLPFKAISVGTETVILDEEMPTGVDMYVTFNVAYPENELWVSSTEENAYVGEINPIEIYVDTGYTPDYGIKISSSDNEIVSVSTSGVLYGFTSFPYDISPYLTAKAEGTAVLTVSLYSDTDGTNLVDTKTINYTVNEVPDWLSTTYIEVPIGGSIDVSLLHDMYDFYYPVITSSDATVVSVGEVDSESYIAINNGKASLAEYLTAEGVGTATIYISGTFMSAGDVSGFFTVSVYDPATRSICLSASELNAVVGGVVDLSIIGLEQGEQDLFIKISSSDASVISVAEPTYSGSTLVHFYMDYSSTVNIAEYLTILKVGTTTLTIDAYDMGANVCCSLMCKVTVIEPWFTVDQTELEVGIGENINVSVISNTDDSVYIFISSSDTNVVSVSEAGGYIDDTGGTPVCYWHKYLYNTAQASLAEYLTAVGVGEATITLSSFKGLDDYQNPPFITTFKVTVTSEPLVELSATEVSTQTDGTVNLNVTAIYGDSTYVVISSSDTTIISVANPTLSTNGTNYHFIVNKNSGKSVAEYLTVNTAGTATITVSSYYPTEDVTYSTTFTVTSTAAPLPAPTLTWNGTTVSYTIDEAYTDEVMYVYTFLYREYNGEKTLKGCPYLYPNTPFDASSYMTEPGAYSISGYAYPNDYNKYTYGATSETVYTYVRKVNFAYDDGITWVAANGAACASVTLLPNQSASVEAVLKESYEIKAWECYDSALEIVSANANPTTITLGEGSTSASDITLNVVSRYTGTTISFSTNNTYGTLNSTTDIKVPSGTSISVDGASVTIGSTTITATPNTADSQYTYVFDGWSGIGDATTTTRNMMIVANFSRTVNRYAINFAVDENSIGYGTLSATTIVANYGTQISFEYNVVTIDGETLTATPVTETEQYEYSFIGWVGKVEIVNNSTTIYAKFARTIRQYTVSFVVNNNTYGSITGGTSITVDYNSPITVNSNVITINGTTFTATPASATSENGFSFVNWSGVKSNVTSNMIITANFTASTKSYTVTINVLNSSYGTVSTTTLTAAYGSTISAVDNILSVGDKHAYATPNTNDMQYEYSYEWIGASGTLTENKTVTLQFSRTEKLYTIIIQVDETVGTISNGSTTGASLSIQVAYGTKITVKDNTITIGEGASAVTYTATANTGLVFDRWLGVVGTVNGNITITADIPAVAVTVNMIGGGMSVMA